MAGDWRYRTPYPPGHRRKTQPRPIGALCTYGNCRKLAQPNRRYPHLATGWCSDTHRRLAIREERTAEEREVANRIRDLLGMPAGRNGTSWTLPELRLFEARIRRLMPNNGRGWPQTECPRCGAEPGAPCRRRVAPGSTASPFLRDAHRERPTEISRFDRRRKAS